MCNEYLDVEESKVYIHSKKKISKKGLLNVLTYVELLHDYCHKTKHGKL